MRFYIDSFGCAKNQVDAENMAAALINTGWARAENAEEADVIIVNSCGFIESAKQESINAVLEWRKQYPQKKIILAGCLAMRYEKELKESLPEADILKKIPRAKARERGNRGEEINAGKRPLFSLPGSAYVKISDGCNNNCAYCAIPLIRGKLKSRPISDIVKECKTLIKRGIKELNIIGQDIGAFGMDQKTGRGGRLPELLNAISKINGRFWVRLLYIHPDHFPLKILNIIERDKRFLPYFDIPFQHASTPVLKTMNRKGTAAQYLNLIKKIRARLPHAVIRSTFLLGFPGETEKDFAALLEFQQKARLDWLGCFAYSREEGTPAYSMKNQVPKKTAITRKQIIEERQIPVTEKQMERFAGQKRIVLIEEEIEGDKTAPTFYLGRLYCHAPEIDGTAVITGADNLKTKPKPGTQALCKVIARRGFDLEAKLV